MPAFIWVGLALAGLAVAAYFWDEIREWAQSNLADAIGSILGAEAKEAFLDMLIDVDKVMTSVRRTAKKVWQAVREALISAAVFIEKRSGNTYIKRMAAFIRKTVEGVRKVYRTVVEEEIPFDDLPDTARAAFMRGSKQEVLQLHAGASPTNNR